jgi:hypothetical protein
MAPLSLERSNRAPTAPRRGPPEPMPTEEEEEAGSVRMKLKDVFVSTNAALLEPPDGAERIVVFAPQRTGALRLALGGDIHAVVEGLRLVDWWPVADGGTDASRTPR